MKKTYRIKTNNQELLIRKQWRKVDDRKINKKPNVWKEENKKMAKRKDIIHELPDDAYICWIPQRIIRR